MTWRRPTPSETLLPLLVGCTTVLFACERPRSVSPVGSGVDGAAREESKRPSPDPVQEGAFSVGESQERRPSSDLSPACRPVRTLETACRRMLEGEKGECAAQDCAVEVLREGHGIRVIEVTTFQQHCEDDCSPVGIFGKPLFFPYGSGGCALPSGRSQQSTVYIESFRRLWPTLTLSSWYQTWSQHDERLVDIQIPDGRHVEWTETLESTEIVEPDGGAGGDVHKSQALRRYLLVGESGPRTIHERLLAESVEDNVTLVPYEGEDDASYAEREAAFEAEQEARGEEPPFEPDPLPEPMPVCEPEESCPAACRK